MASASYEARRDLIAGHTVGVTYAIDFELSALKRPSGNDLKVKTESISGAVETLYFGEVRIWNVTTTPIQLSSDEADQMYEFLRSTADGQEFTFDPYGYGEALVVSPVTVVREDDGFTETQFMEIDGQNDYVQFAFQVREV